MNTLLCLVLFLIKSFTRGFMTIFGFTLKIFCEGISAFTGIVGLLALVLKGLGKFIIAIGLFSCFIKLDLLEAFTYGKPITFIINGIFLMLIGMLVEWICFSGKDILYGFSELFTYYGLHGNFEGLEDKYEDF